MSVKKKIPSPQVPPKTPIVTKDYFDNLPIVIDFKYLQLANVRSGDFHNFCENRQAALSQVSDFMYTLGVLSQHKRKELDQQEIAYTTSLESDIQEETTEPHRWCFTQ